MSITMGELASRFAKAAQQLPSVTDKQVQTLAKVGEGLVKSEIHNVHAVDTGTMLNSTTVEKVAVGEYLIGPTVNYAVYVALGTSRMPGRPFHITAARKLEGMIPDIMDSGELGI